MSGVLVFLYSHDRYPESLTDPSYKAKSLAYISDDGTMEFLLIFKMRDEVAFSKARRSMPQLW